MPRTIAIELEVNGVKESVKTIGELETAIEQLTEELKNTDIGTEKFNKLTTELNNARSELKTFEKQFEGLEPEQKAQAYIAFGEGVVSGILLAQEALRSFGIENEDVNNAVEKSTQAINLALQARIVIESVLQARVLATTLAQSALNTSFVAGNTALRALFTTMAANPIGAVVAAIGLLVTAFIALSDSSEDNTDSLEDNEAAQKSLELQSKRLKRELTELNDATSEYIDNLDNLDLSTAIDEASRLEQELSDLKETTEEIRNLDFTSIAQDLIRGDADLRDFNLSLAEQKRLFDILIDATDRYEGALRDAQGQNAETLQENLKNIERVSNELQEQIERTEGNTEALEKKLEAVNKRIKDLRSEISKNELSRFSKQLEQAADELDRLNRSVLEFGELPEPPIVKELQRLIELQNRYIELTNESEKSLSQIFSGFFVEVKEASGAIDIFGRKYDDTRELLSEAFVFGDPEKFQDAISQVEQEYLGSSSQFTEEQKQAVASLITQYTSAFETLRRLGLEAPDEFKKVVIPLLDGIAAKLQLEGSIQFKEIKGIEVLLNDLEEFDGGLFDPDVEAESIERIKLDLLTLQEGTKEFYERRDELISLFTENYLKEARFRKLADEDEASAREAALKLATETADGVIETISSIASAEDVIRGVNNQVEDLTIKLSENQDNIAVIIGRLIENFDKIGEEYNIVDLFTDDENDERNLQQALDLLEKLGLEGVDVIFDTEEEKARIVEFFLKKRQELLEENAEQEKKTQQELLDETLSNYQEIVNGLNQLTLSLGEKSQLEIERIERRREQSLNNIVGDTEEAEKLRTEITEEANKEIVEIERRARLRELQFTKIQAIADLAQALINAQKLPLPFSAIQSGIVAVAGGIQIGVIQSQIDDLQGAQGFATGGFVSGPGTSTSDSIPALLSDGEFVVNAKSTKRFLPLLERINNQEEQFRRFNNGGFVLNGSSFMGSTIQNNFDDSRIIEELRRTRQEPLRAYVFEKDITEAQQIEKRLQELSKL
jgi:hypothetical protein